MQVKKEFISTYGEKHVFVITLCNNTGTIVNVINYGAIIKDILFPGPDNSLHNLVLSYDSVEDYYNDPHYVGCIVGRYANRIAGGLLKINNQTYQLGINESNANNHLHGGYYGFNKKVWNVDKTFKDHTKAGVTLSVDSPHLEEGYPGNLKAEVSYTLTDTNELLIKYKATTDQATVINLTNHTYFNLAAGKRDISAHLLSVQADKYTPVNEQNIPLGPLEPVDNSAFDLRIPKKAGDFMHKIQTLNYCLNNISEVQPAAVLTDPESEISLEVRATNPGLQLYCGNYLSGKHKPFSGICLEPHYYPDSPNHTEYPSTLLLPGQVYREITSYKFNMV